MKKFFNLISICLIAILVPILFIGCTNTDPSNTNTNPSNQFNIELNVNNTEYGLVYGAGQYYEGQTVTFVAVAKEGYEFDAWSDGSQDAIRTITVDSNENITANFKEKWLVHEISRGIEVKFHGEEAIEDLLCIGIKKLEIKRPYEEYVPFTYKDNGTWWYDLSLIYYAHNDIYGGYSSANLPNQSIGTREYGVLAGGKRDSITFQMHVELEAVPKDTYTGSHIEFEEKYSLNQTVTFTIERDFTQANKSEFVRLIAFEDVLCEGTYITFEFDVKSQFIK